MRFDKEGIRCVPGYDPLDIIGVILKPDIYTSGNRIRLAGFIIEADHQIASVLVAEGQSSSGNLLLSFWIFRVNPALQLDIYRFLGTLDQLEGCRQDHSCLSRIIHWLVYPPAANLGSRVRREEKQQVKKMVADRLKELTEGVTSGTPERAWYSVSSKGLLEAAKL